MGFTWCKDHEIICFAFFSPVILQGYLADIHGVMGKKKEKKKRAVLSKNLILTVVGNYIFGKKTFSAALHKNYAL